MAFSLIRLRTLEELKFFYENRLPEKLKPFETRRKLFLRLAIGSSIALELSYLGFILYLNREKLASVPERLREFPVLIKIVEMGVCSLGVFLICFFISYLIYECFQDKKTFKEKIIQAIIKFIDIDQILSYSVHTIAPQFTERALSFSAILKAPPDKFSEEDCIYGATGKMSFCLSEVVAEQKRKRKIKSKTGPDRTETYYVTLFRGPVLRAEFDQPFDFFLNIRSRGANEKLPDTYSCKRIAGIDYAINTGSATFVDLKDGEFSKLFLVYSDRPSEVFPLLSTGLKQDLIKLRQIFHRDVFVSINQNRLVVALDCPTNLFEPVFFGSLLKFETVQAYFEPLELMFGVLAELNPHQG